MSSPASRAELAEHVVALAGQVRRHLSDVVVAEPVERTEAVRPPASLGVAALLELRIRLLLVREALATAPDAIAIPGVAARIDFAGLGEIEVGVRKLVRFGVFEFEEVTVADGQWVQVPTLAEALRMQAYMLVTRNRMRDYQGVATLSASLGAGPAAAVLANLDSFYTDPDQAGQPARSQMVRQLGHPRPAPAGSAAGLTKPRSAPANELDVDGEDLDWADLDRTDLGWADLTWDEVVATSVDVAARMLTIPAGPEPMAGLAFRNLKVDPADAVAQWGFEGLLAAVDRGEASHWARIGAVVVSDPWGQVATTLETEVFAVAADSGVVGALRAMLHRQRRHARSHHE